MLLYCLKSFSGSHNVKDEVLTPSCCIQDLEKMIRYCLPSPISYNSTSGLVFLKHFYSVCYL